MFNEHTINDSTQWPRLMRDSADLIHRIQSYSNDPHPFGGIVASPYPAIKGRPLPPALFEWYIRTHNLSPRCLHGLLASVTVASTVRLACPLRYDACPWSVSVTDAFAHAEYYGHAEYPLYPSLAPTGIWYRSQRVLASITLGDFDNPWEGLNFIDINLDMDFNARDNQGMDDEDDVDQDTTNGVAISGEAGEDRDTDDTDDMDDMDDSDTESTESTHRSSHSGYDSDEPVYDVKPYEGFLRVRGPCITYGEHYTPPHGAHHALWALSGEGVDEKTFRSLFVQCPCCDAYMLGDAYPEHDCSSVADSTRACRSMLMEDGLAPKDFHGLFGRCTSCLLYLDVTHFDLTHQPICEVHS